MGTRGFYGLTNADHTTIKGSYNHYDSNPECLGANIVRDVVLTRPTAQTLQLMEQYPSNDDRAPGGLVERIHKITGGSDGGLGEDRALGFYGLMRDLQGELAKNIEAQAFCGEPDFLKDSLFCEWAYLYNVDTQKLEVYEGFNKCPADVPEWMPKEEDSGYYPVKLVKEISLAEMEGIMLAHSDARDAYFSGIANREEEEE